MYTQVLTLPLTAEPPPGKTLAIKSQLFVVNDVPLGETIFVSQTVVLTTPAGVLVIGVVYQMQIG
jgi:hypothetical protein